MRKRLSNPIEDMVDSDGVSTSLVRGLQILRSFRPGEASLGNLELMARTGLPKATVSRLTYTLASLGYLVYDDLLGRYSLGSATVSLGYTALSSNAVVHVSRSLMQALADETGAAVALGTRDQSEMVYLSNCRSESLVTLRLNVGSRIPLWNSGMGLAYLVGLSEERRKQLKDRYMPRTRAERASLSKLLDQALEQYARLGYVTAVGTWHSYIKAVGVPFQPIDGSPPLAFSCGGTAEIIDDQAIAEKIGPALVRMRVAVEEILAGTPRETASAPNEKKKRVKEKP
ncbi:IclR family transcriptional regulator [Mesorhizobium sp. B3-1-3]|uniref:IclR family transcriptional regulator n=1 Tax=unclassified Mesorhizobium TaxID=325217 RepID=UPI00112E552E|nr:MULTISPECIES: IclR family transcriptional regulator [unclassified Mesorhizobium]TPI57349.1 IclR family transcriptional regulator [Mesorhizobium sp. B3-1-8]TPI63502.1 IclR family transcriptional regulator [Mesorhizobium sp. B3-1-3]